MFILYDLTFLPFFIFGFFYYLFKGKFHSELHLRYCPQIKEKLERPIWLHAVSVGEAKVAKNIYSILKQNYPNKHIVISTVTPTGQRIVKSFISGKDQLIYLPIDFSFIVRKFVNLINPSLFISIETEIWPNLIYFLHKNNTPIIIVNGRISPGSFFGYSIFKLSMKPILNRVDLFCMQTELDAKRIIKIGADTNKVKITGNIKFDLEISHDSIKKVDLGLSSNDLVWLAGSTNPGEEEIALEVYKNLSKDYKDLRLLLAPRHTERTHQIEQLVSKFGFESIRFSQIKGSSSRIIILDVMGRLAGLYNIADIVFIGGSLVKKGGQNILEPASFAKPIIFGPYMFNFVQIKDLFLKEKAAVQVNDKLELEEKLRSLLLDPNERNRLGQRARSLLEENKGATLRTFGLIKELIEKPETRVQKPE